MCFVKYLKPTTCCIQQELNQHPAFMRDIDLSKPLSSAVEGMMAMKYESDSAQGGNILTVLPSTGAPYNTPLSSNWRLFIESCFTHVSTK